MNLPNTMMLFEPAFPVASIVPREPRTRNRTAQTERALTQMIERFGWVQPLTLDADYRIIDGQYRLELAKKWKLETVPVVISNGVSARNGTTDLFHMLAGRILEWDKWNHPATDEILKSLDGGLTTEDSLGFDAPSEAGELRDLARILGWFVEIIPTTLTASSSTLDTLATLLQKQLGSKYQYDAAQLLYVEALRKEILDTRLEMIEEGDTSGGIVSKLKRHLEDEETATRAGKVLADLVGFEQVVDEATGKVSFTVEPEVNYILSKRDEEIDRIRAMQDGAEEAQAPPKYPFSAFWVLVRGYGDWDEQQATEFYEASSQDEIIEEIQRLLDQAEPAAD